FGGEQFLQNISGAIRLERPYFHFAEALSTELRLAAQRLLGNQRIRSDGASVDLVVHQVRELEHINVADRHRLLKRHSRDSVMQLNLARGWQLADGQLLLDVLLGRAVEDRGCKMQAQSLRRPTQMGFENLPHV